MPPSLPPEDCIAIDTGSPTLRARVSDYCLGLDVGKELEEEEEEENEEEEEDEEEE